MINRQDFLTDLMNQGVSRDEWQSRLDEYRNTYGAFLDDKEQAPVMFTPAQVFAQKAQLQSMVEEQENMTMDAAMQGLREQLHSAEVQYQLDSLSSEMITREDLGLGEDEEIDNQAYIEKRQAEYDLIPTVRTPFDQFEYEFNQAGINTPTRVQEGGFDPQQQSFSTFNAMLGLVDAGINKARFGNFRERVINGEIGEKSLLTGGIIPDSMGTVDRYRMGAVMVDDNHSLSQKFTDAALTGNVSELQKEINRITEFNLLIGDAAYADGKNGMARIWDDTVGIIAPMVETSLITTLPYVGTAGATLYWQQQGAGSVLYEIYKDKDLSEISQEELQESLAIANAIGIPYALVERFARSVPWAKQKGRAFAGKLANAMFRKALTDPNFKRKAARLGTGYVMNVTTELGEETIQEILLDVGVQVGDKDITGVDIQRLLDSGKEAFLEARYAVLGLGGVGFAFDAVSLNKEIKQVEKRINAMEKVGYSAEDARKYSIAESGGFIDKKTRKEALLAVDASRLVNRGVTSDINMAENLARDFNEAKTAEQKKNARINIQVQQILTIAQKIEEPLQSKDRVDVNGEEVLAVATKIDAANEETGTRILQGFLQRHKISVVAQNLTESLGVPKERAFTLAQQLDAVEDAEEMQSILNGLQEEFNIYQMEQGDSFIYGRLGAITETEWNRYGRMKPETVQAIIQKNGMDEETARLFTRGANGDKSARQQYNDSLEAKRQEAYKVFVNKNKLNNLIDTDVTIEQTGFPEIHSQQIRAGVYDEQVRKFGDKYNISDLPIEEQRLQFEETIKRKYEQQDQRKKKEDEYESIDVERKKQLRNVRRNVLQSIAEISPDTKIVMHKSRRAFARATGDANARGYYIDETGNVHIDESSASVGVIAHEVFHRFAAIAMVNGEFETQAKEVFQQILPNLKPEIRKKTEAYLNSNEELGWEGYEESGYYYEEGLAKVLELMSEEYHTLPQQDKSALRKLIESIMDFLGLTDYSKQIFTQFGVDFDVDRMTRRELQYRAKLLGIEGRNVSTAELRNKIGDAVSGQELEVIHAMQNLAIKLTEGITVQQRDLDFVRPDFENQTRNQLAKRAKQLGLPATGTKKELIKRIRETHPNLRASKHALDDPNFNKKFEGSVVVNEDGNPLEVYHGTPDTFAELEVRDGMLFFSPDIAVAEQFSRGVFTYGTIGSKAVPRIYNAYLSIKKPLVLDDLYMSGAEARPVYQERMLSQIQSQYNVEIDRSKYVGLSGKEFIQAIRDDFGIDGIVSDIISIRTGGRVKQYTIFEIDQYIPANTIPTYGRRRAARRMPRTDADAALEMYIDDIFDLETEFDLDLDLPETLLSNRVEREERAIRDFDLLAPELPDNIEYSVGYIDGEAVVYMDIPDVDAETVKDIKELADKTHVKIVTDKQLDGFIEINGSFEYRPVRGRHIETLKISELRSLAKEMGISTAGIDLDFLQKMETMYRAGGKISPVRYQASLTADVTNEEISQEIDRASLRPEDRAALQRTGVVPEVGRENYRTTVATNRQKFLETRQELLNRLRPEVGDFLPRDVRGRRAAKDRTPAEIDALIDELVAEMKAKTKKPKTKAETRSETKKTFRGRVASRIRTLANLYDVPLRNIVKVAEYTGDKKIIEQFRVGKRGSDGAIINAVVIGNKIYYFAGRDQYYQGAKQKIFYRVDENGLEIMPNGEAITIGALIDADTRIEQTMVGYTEVDAGLYMYAQSLETRGKRPNPNEKFRDPTRAKQRELKQDDFGLSRMTRAEIIQIGKDERVGAFKGLGKKLGVIKSLDDILADMGTDDIIRIVKRELNAVRKEAISYQEERETYRNTLTDDLGLDPDSLSFEEMRGLHEARIAEEQQEYDETELGDEDDFLEFMKGIEAEKDQRKKEGTQQGALTVEQLERTTKAYGDAEPVKFEQQKFDNILFRASTEYDKDDVDALASQIIADEDTGVVTGLTVVQLTSLKLRITQLEDEIEQLTLEISDAMDMVTTGGGSNWGNVIAKQEVLRKSQHELTETVRAARIVSSQWGKTGVALRMSRTERGEFRLGQYINMATKNYNMNKNGEPADALPEDVLKKISEDVQALRRIDKELDDVTKRKREAEEVWDRDEAFKMVFDKTIKGGRWIAVALEGYVPKSEIGRLASQEERLEALRKGILLKIKGFGYEVATTYSANNGNRASRTRKELAEFHTAVMDLMKYHVYVSGVTTLDELIPLIQADVPMLSEIEIIRTISNRSKSAQKQLSSAEKKTMQKLKTLARLQDDIDRALRGFRRPRADRKPVDQEVRSMRILLRQYEALLKDTERDDEIAQQIMEQVNRIELGIENVINPRIPQRQKSEALKEAENALRDIRKRKNVEAEIEQIESILKEKDRSKAIGRWEAVYGVLSKKEKTPQSAELKELLTKRNKRKRELDDYVANLKLRDADWWAKAKIYGLEIAGIPRQMLASVDFSYFMRQGLLGIFMNPKIAATAYIEAFKALKESNAGLIDVGMRTHPRFAEMEQLGLDLTRYDGRAVDSEEVFINSLVNRIPYLGAVTRASERHMVTGLNYLRFGLMEQFLNSPTGHNASKEAQMAFAKYINVMTGRAKMPTEGMDGLMTGLGQIFFSPRFAYSRFILPASTIKTAIENPELRKIIAMQWMSMTMTGLMVLGLSYMALPPDEQDEFFEEFFNVYSSNFGLIPIGDARYDIFGGMMQPFRFGARLLAESINTGLDGEKKFWDSDINVAREIQKFLGSKTSPQFAMLYEAIFKEDIRYGGDVDFTDPETLKDFFNIAPLSLQGLVEVFGEAVDGEMSYGLAGASFAMEFHGFGVNIWNDQDRRSKSTSNSWEGFKY